MKRLLLIGCLLAAFACTKDPAELSGGDSGPTPPRIVGTPTSELALKGSLSIKLSSEMAQTVAAAQAQLPATRSGAVTRSGVGTIDDLLNEIGAERFERIITYNPEWEDIYDETGINRWYSVSFDESADLDQIGSRFAALPGVTVVEYEIDPAYIRPTSVGPAIPASGENLRIMGETRAATTMNDPMLPYQWHFDNTGPDQDFSQPKAGADINLLDAWQLCTGSEDIIVAVIDQPVQTDHPDLKANIWTDPKNAQVHGYNFWDDSSVLDWKTPGKENGRTVYADHGTHVAGVIAAVNNNGRGVCGIAGGRSNQGGVKIMSCQIMGYSEGAKKGNANVKAFEYAWTNGAVIAQNSWGYVSSEKGDPITSEEWEGQDYSLTRDAINTFIRGAGAKNPNSPLQGGLVIFSAGNNGDISGNTARYPAAYSPAIAVGAMDWSFRPAYYTDYGSWVDITAPGGDFISSDNYGNGGVLSTILCDDTMNFEDDRKDDYWYGYGFMQGTSMACPHVSGVAALGLAYAAQNGKKYTPSEFKALLLSSIYGIDDYFTGSRMGDGMIIPDLSIYKKRMGGGCVDALKLLLAIKGTPAIYVKTGEATTVDFSRYFGGDKSVVALESAQYASPSNLGVGSSSAVFNGTKITFECSRTGTSLLTISAKAGDTTIEREFAIVSRPNLAANGGWL
ncbi:S8 family serine peptidase [Alistipes sp.]|uniref:S8 family serine peptidase n=1 Tax=Alistipes sp. TaxID=1872444 RepID=UPI003AB3B987